MNPGLNIFKNAQRMQGGMQVVNNLGYDPSKPTVGFGSGEPTRRGIDIGVSGAANVFLPGFGWIAGKIARGLWHTIQNMQMRGASKQDIQQVVQQAQQQQGGGETDTGGTGDPGATAPPTQDKPPPSAGVGIDPWGNPADPGEWWSDDFGRWTGGDEFGTTPGNYNLRGPGGVFGMHGLPSGHTVQVWDTAIGLSGEYGGGSNAGDTSRFASAFGYSKPYTEAQYNAPTSSHGTGQGPGYKLGPGWTPRASYAQYLQGFHPIGTAGSSTGPGGAAFQPFGPKGIGGGTPTFKPANQKAFAMGTSDVGLKIFKRLQRGTDNLEPGPLPPEKRLIGPKERAGIYDPGGVPTEEEDQDMDEDDMTTAAEQRGAIGLSGSYKTIGVNINGRETEIPMWEGQTPAEAEEMARMRFEWGLDPFAPDSELERVQNAAHQGPDDASALQNNYAHGTSSVNQGLYFYRKQLKKPKKEQTK